MKYVQYMSKKQNVKSKQYKASKNIIDIDKMKNNEKNIDGMQESEKPELSNEEREKIWIEKFNKNIADKIKIIKDAKTISNEIKAIQKSYINSFKFITKNSSDIKASLLLTAQTSLDRKASVQELIKYVDSYKIADQIEKGIFEYILIQVTMNKFQEHFVVNMYQAKLYDICINLDTKNKNIDNQTLIKTVMDESFNPYFIAFLSPDQLHPKRWADPIAKKQLREETMNNLQTTDLYKCAKCGERKFKITQLQLRSADEPISSFHTCMVCYHTFIK